MTHVFIEASASSSLLTHCRAARLKPYKSCRCKASRSSWGLVLQVWCAEVSLILTSKETNMAHWLPSRNKAVHTNYPGMSVCVYAWRVEYLHFIPGDLPPECGCAVSVSQSLKEVRGWLQSDDGGFCQRKEGRRGERVTGRALLGSCYNVTVTHLSRKKRHRQESSISQPFCAQ